MGASKKIYSDKTFRSLIEQSDDAIQLVTPKGEVLYSSDSVKQVIGYTPDELQGVSVGPYLHPDDVALFERQWKKLLAKQSARIELEYRVKHKDGSWVWVETRATNHIKTPGIEALVGNFRNITDRKQTEERLRESEEQYRQLVDRSPEAIAVHAHGKIVYVNKIGLKLIGATSAKQVLGESLMKFVHPDSVELVKQRVRAMIVEQKPTDTAQEKFIRLDGQVIDVEVVSLPVRYKGEPAIQIVVRDITDRKRTHDALQKSEERLRFMAATMPQKMFTATPGGAIDYVNPQWESFAGIKHEGLLGDGWIDLLHPDDLEDSLARWRHSVRTGEPFSIEQRFRRHDGEYRWHISRARAMMDDAGNITRWFGSNTDIHDIRAALKREHALEKKTVQLTEQRTQLVMLNRAKDEFIALASHQLRTPATAVKQYLGMLLGGYAGEMTEKQQAMVAFANKSNERQIRIINDLLEVARLDAGKVDLKIDRVDLSALIDQVIEEQSSSIEGRSQRVRVDGDDQPVLADVDGTKLRMVLENILHNASKYSGEHTTITITMSCHKDTAVIAIRDEGVGIAPQDVAKLFRKFSRLDNPLSDVVGGTGLGLYWAKRIIDLHGGSIKAESEPGEGSTFTITLPTHASTKVAKRIIGHKD